MGTSGRRAAASARAIVVLPSWGSPTNRYACERRPASSSLASSRRTLWWPATPANGSRTNVKGRGPAESAGPGPDERGSEERAGEDGPGQQRGAAGRAGRRLGRPLAEPLALE